MGRLPDIENRMVLPYADDDAEIMPEWQWAEDSERQQFEDEQESKE